MDLMEDFETEITRNKASLKSLGMRHSYSRCNHEGCLKDAKVGGQAHPQKLGSWGRCIFLSFEWNELDRK